ncbi:uncharacterized protein RMCFA_5558 [Mycolicibacterium fortuitum subsp. acetamidolyticum]|uniref:Uncharacterized protein n=1 Tax=Mycolicibacterium fortuitum subsp. acetamidolyticum TaxID=144550 RepID=A0A100WW14_MYCFO|nr:hypothetical protein [Mycolicibacterium fortuitum]MCV7137721.1 hypothetical protein [Mycolicibacterium fortuitum]GAT05447.1 uncharacterized protein RMCFA_5558 [Mycolicibacterium fortuitum subsp. acetamidolyticum]
MSSGLAVLPIAVREEDDIEQPFVEYLWPDLKGRRNALSLWPEDLAELYEMDLTRYRTVESGARDLLGPVRNFVDELIAMEAFVTSEMARLIEDVPDEGTAVLNAVVDQDEFAAVYPDARTLLLQKPYPVTLQYVAVGRVAAELRRLGRNVEVYRADRRFDLAAARSAVGLGKAETAHLLGINPKSYNTTERTRGVREASLKDLQAVDDFIAAAAGELEVTEKSGVSVVWLRAGQGSFEKTYPNARVQRSGTRYPVRMLWIAAGRRAGVLAAAGHAVRIAVIN